MSKNIPNTLAFFDFCTAEKGNQLLNRVFYIALSFLYSHISEKAITDIQLSGSVANGEGTVMYADSEIIASDFDLMVTLRFPYYLAYRLTRIDQQVSEKTTMYLHSKNIKTHVCFSINSLFLKRVINLFQKMSIYNFENIFNKSLFNNYGKKNRAVYTSDLPSQEDALQLIFTILAEYLIYVPHFSEMEKIYWYVKRHLTLLYSMLIFKGIPQVSYTERVEAFTSLPKKVIAPSEKSIYQAFLNFKLSGDLNYIFTACKSQNLKEIIRILEKSLTTTVLRILTYQIAHKYSSNSKGVQNISAFEALSLYFCGTSQSLSKTLLYSSLLLVVTNLTRRYNATKFSKISIARKHSPVSIANYLIGLMFLLKVDLNNYSAVELAVKELGFIPESKGVTEFWHFGDGVKYLW